MEWDIRREREGSVEWDMGSEKERRDGREGSVECMWDMGRECGVGYSDTRLESRII